MQQGTKSCDQKFVTPFYSQYLALIVVSHADCEFVIAVIQAAFVTFGQTCPIAVNLTLAALVLLKDILHHMYYYRVIVQHVCQHCNIRRFH